MEYEFLKHLRAALNHLYNSEQLRKNPLIPLFKLTDRFDSPAVLQRILIDAIEAMRPTQNEPLHSDKRKTYEILQYRYVQQFKQEEVAHHLGVSDRQFRREQDGALEILAIALWNKYSARIEATTQPSLPIQTQFSPITDSSEEWNWLKKARSERIVNLNAFIGKIINLMEGVGRQNHTNITWIENETLPDLAVHPIAFRQILLNLIQVAIHKAKTGNVHIEAIFLPPFVTIQVVANPVELEGSKDHSNQEGNLMGIAVHLSNLCGGKLTASEIEKEFKCELVLPAVQGVPVLVVDDNIEIIELIRRYTSGTRYNLVGSSEPEQAVDFSIETGAQIIVIDVMMPKIDGWELLGRLRSHPKTSGIPVIVLSILAQEDLAYSLGAQKLVVKPVTQEAFLSALDEILANQSSESQQPR